MKDILAENELYGHIYKVLCKCHRNCDKPDLHSFWIATAEGPCFVEYRENKVIISGTDKKWVLPIEEAAKKLALMGADLQTMDM